MKFIQLSNFPKLFDCNIQLGNNVYISISSISEESLLVTQAYVRETQAYVRETQVYIRETQAYIRKTQAYARDSSSLWN